MTVAPPGGPGLTVAWFLDSLPDRELRRFLDPGVLSVLDAIFGGRIDGEDLRRVTRTLVDFDVLLGEREGRRLVLHLIPEQKRAELETRVGRVVAAAGASDWTESEIRRLRDFFGLVEERLVPPAVPPTDIITPGYGLFDHQRNAVRKLAPLLGQDDRRAVLHLPTGVGKTRTAMHVVADSLRAHEPSVVVWLASGRELLEQAVVAFKEAWTHLGRRPLQIGTMWGDRMPNLGHVSPMGFLPSGSQRAGPRFRAPTRIGLFGCQSESGWSSLTKRTRALPEPIGGSPRTSRWISGVHCWDSLRRRGGLGPISTRTVSLPSSISGNKVTLEVSGENPIEHLIEQRLSRTTNLPNAPCLGRASRITENEACSHRPRRWKSLTRGRKRSVVE